MVIFGNRKEKGPETILIVDDDSEIREILRILLCRNGFIVKEAADAKEALLKLDSVLTFSSVEFISRVMNVSCSKR